MAPSADDATDDHVGLPYAGGKSQGMLFDVQVAPESAEVKRPMAPAARRVPSAEQATEYQRLDGALVGNQFAPEFVERKIKPCSVFDLL